MVAIKIHFRITQPRFAQASRANLVLLTLLSEVQEKKGGPFVIWIKWPHQPPLLLSLSLVHEALKVNRGGLTRFDAF